MEMYKAKVDTANLGIVSLGISASKWNIYHLFYVLLYRLDTITVPSLILDTV